jgi:hypothetical protein
MLHLLAWGLAAVAARLAGSPHPRKFRGIMSGMPGTVIRGDRLTPRIPWEHVCG